MPKRGACLGEISPVRAGSCLLYTSDAADERSSVDLGGRRIIKKKKYKEHSRVQDMTLENNKMREETKRSTNHDRQKTV